MLYTKVCTKCKVKKELTEFYPIKNKKDRYKCYCKICSNELISKYRLENADKIKKYKKNYCLNNVDKIKEYRNKYKKNRRNTDSLYKLKHNISTLIRISIKANGHSKKSRTQKILGCSFEEFKLHIEKQFTEGMSWENRSDWHLDHIYPVSLAKDEEELIKLNHYTNFQPL